MLARLMLNPAGLVKKALRITLRRADGPASEPVRINVPPIWPHRFQGTGISLTTELEAPVSNPTAGAGGASPGADAYLSQYGRAASFLDPAAP